jgi:hypothetical protein
LQVQCALQVRSASGAGSVEQHLQASTRPACDPRGRACGARPFARSTRDIGAGALPQLTGAWTQPDGCWSGRPTIGRLEPRATGHTPSRDAHLKRTSKPPSWVLKRSDGRRTMVEWTPKRLMRGAKSAVQGDLNAPRETMRVIGRLQVPQPSRRPISHCRHHRRRSSAGPGTNGVTYESPESFASLIASYRSRIKRFVRYSPCRASSFRRTTGNVSKM